MPAGSLLEVKVSSKLSFLMDGSGEGKALGKSFSWKEYGDGTWEFQNGDYIGRGHFIVASYAGSAGGTNISNHELRVGYAMGIKNAKCWKISETIDPTHFECCGIAMGWYEDTDGVFVQVTGTIKGLGAKWTAGNKVYVPSTFGHPEQKYKQYEQGHVLGLALNERDLLLIPKL